RDLEGTPSSDLSSSDIAFHALRDYAPGDDRSHVHWRTTARTGKLMVRQFEETRRSHVVVALDDLAEHYASDEEFELAVSAAASPLWGGRVPSPVSTTLAMRSSGSRSPRPPRSPHRP